MKIDWFLFFKEKLLLTQRFHHLTVISLDPFANKSFLFHFLDFPFAFWTSIFTICCTRHFSLSSSYFSFETKFDGDIRSPHICLSSLSIQGTFLSMVYFIINFTSLDPRVSILLLLFDGIIRLAEFMLFCDFIF